MIVRKSIVQYYTQFLLLYLLILGFSIALIAGQDNGGILTGQADFSANGMSLMEIIVYNIYQYVLNFPLSIFNWFTERFLFTTYYFAVPNSLVVAWLVSKLFPTQRREINKTMYYVLIVFGIIMTTLISYSFAHVIFAE